MHDVLPQEREHWKKMFCGMMKKREIKKPEQFLHEVVKNRLNEAIISEEEFQDMAVDAEIEKELLENNERGLHSSGAEK